MKKVSSVDAIVCIGPDSYVCIVAVLSSEKDLFSSYSNERAGACQRKRLECFHTISCFAEHMVC